MTESKLERNLELEALKRFTDAVIDIKVSYGYDLQVRDLDLIKRGLTPHPTTPNSNVEFALQELKFGIDSSNMSELNKKKLINVCDTIKAELSKIPALEKRLQKASNISQEGWKCCFNSKSKLNAIEEVIKEYGVNCAFPNHKLHAINKILNRSDI